MFFTKESKQLASSKFRTGFASNILVLNRFSPKCSTKIQRRITIVQIYVKYSICLPLFFSLSGLFCFVYLILYCVKYALRLLGS